jgi:hypothetical protein
MTFSRGRLASWSAGKLARPEMGRFLPACQRAGWPVGRR